MSVTSFIRRCLDTGMPIDMALAAAEAFEAETPPTVSADERRREMQRARQARYEARKRQADDLTSGASENVILTSDDAKEPPPEPPKKNTPSPPLKGGISPGILPSSPEKPKLKPTSAWVAEIWEITPRQGRERSGRPALETALKAAERRGSDLAAVKTGIAGYYASPDATKDGGQFAKGVHVVISSGRWEAFAEPEPEPPSRGPEDPWPQRLLRWRVAKYWDREWGPPPDKPGYRGPRPEGLAA